MRISETQILLVLLLIVTATVVYEVHRITKNKTPVNQTVSTSSQKP